MKAIDPLLAETAANILNRMMIGAHLSICDIDKAAKLLGVPETGDTYEKLRKLHCVAWSDMPKALRDQVPALINELLGSDQYHFAFSAPRQAEPVDVTPRKGGLLRLLSGA